MRVVVPWRATDPHRLAALEWVTARWAAAGFPVTLGSHCNGRWRKALAVADGLAGFDGDVLVVADADIWTDGFVEALDLVRSGEPWVIPHRKVHRLSQTATAQVLNGAEPYEGMELDPLRPDMPGFAYVGVAGGGAVVLRRDVYEDCPIDPRFAGWGQEDESWALALSCLYGQPKRLDWPLWHLWHPPQDRQDRGVGSPEGMALYKRYAKTKRRPEEMRALISEAR